MTRSPGGNPQQELLRSLDEIIHRRSVIISSGTGGVGKTTLSAAIAVRAAMLGRRAVVVTMDPAKRLAQSLGVSTLGDEPMDLTAKLREVVDCEGSLAAIIPDTQRTFENFVRSLADDPAVYERVIRNPIFQIFAKEYSGTNEYMALKRLDLLHETGKYDFIVLDTPPSRNTLGFLDAPNLLANFFDEKIISWLVVPANKLVSAGMRRALGILESLTGQGFITQLVEFASALFEVRMPFTRNLKRVTTLLQSDECGLLLVSVPAPDTVPDALHFLRSSREKGLAVDGIILNRTLTDLPIRPDELKSAEAAADGGRPGLKQGFEIIRSLQDEEKKVITELESCLNESNEGANDVDPSKHHGFASIRLPQMARDIHSLEDLVHIAGRLAGPDS